MICLSTGVADVTRSSDSSAMFADTAVRQRLTRRARCCQSAADGASSVRCNAEMTDDQLQLATATAPPQVLHICD